MRITNDVCSFSQHNNKMLLLFSIVVALLRFTLDGHYKNITYLRLVIFNKIIIFN